VFNRVSIPGGAGLFTGERYPANGFRDRFCGAGVVGDALSPAWAGRGRFTWILIVALAIGLVTSWLFDNFPTIKWFRPVAVMRHFHAICVKITPPKLLFCAKFLVFAQKPAGTCFAIKETRIAGWKL